MQNEILPPPPIDAALIAYLESVYPERSPDRWESLDDMRTRAGHAEVVRMLRTHYNAQNTREQEQ